MLPLDTFNDIFDQMDFAKFDPVVNAALNGCS